MSEESTQLRFTALEQQFGAVAAALRDGDVSQLESLSTQLHQMTVDFARELGNFSALAKISSTQLRRLQALSQGFPVLRESLLRRQALVDQALKVAVPALQTQTYAAPQASPYGVGGPRASGRIQGISA